MGFSPDLAVGVFLGFDQPKSLGNAATAGQYAAPVFRDFMQMALKDKPATPFRVPPGIKLIRVNASTGMRVGQGEGGGTILEAFKPGTTPPDTYAPPAEAEIPQADASPAAQRAVGVGTGGLYSSAPTASPYKGSPLRPRGGLSFTPRGAARKTPQDHHGQFTPMRAEIQHLVDETKQSVGLLRRHL